LATVKRQNFFALEQRILLFTLFLEFALVEFFTECHFAGS